MMLPNESEKQKMKSLLKIIEKMMYKNIYPNNIVNGFIVLLFHWLIVGWAIIYIFLGEVNNYFFIATTIWLTIFILHIYFHGCILTKIEKHLWNAKDWCGPWSLPFKLFNMINIHVSSEYAKYIYICWACLLIIFISLKIVYSSEGNGYIYYAMLK